MPGMLIPPGKNASQIPFAAAGNVSAANVQAAIEEVDTEKASTTSVTNVETSVTNLQTDISDVEGVALRGIL